MNDTTLGIVLKQSDYKNYDSLIKVYTRQYGKLTVVAKGIRKPTSKNSGSCMPFCCSEFIIDYSYNKSIYTMKKSSIITNNFKIYESLKMICAANVVCELVDKCFADLEAESEVFEICDYLLKKINKGEELYLCVCLMLVKILKSLGISPNIDACSNCGEDVISAISLKAGGFICDNCKREFPYEIYNLENLKRFRYLVKACYHDYDKLFSNIQCTKTDCDLLFNFLNYHYSININSYEFFIENMK